MPMSDYMRAVRAAVGHRLLEVPSVGVAVRDAEDRLLVVRHVEGDVWVLPGGAVEPEERPADAAVREAFEETGLRIGLSGVVGVYGGPEYTIEYGNGDRTSYLVVVFAGHVLGGRPRPDGVETLEVRFASRAELATLPTPAWFAEVERGIYGGPAFRPAAWRGEDAG